MKNATSKPESRKANPLVRTQGAILRAILDEPSDSIAVVDEKGVLLEINQTMAHRLGKSKKSLIGCNLWKILPAKSASRRKKFALRVFQTQKPLRFEDERDGVWFDQVFTPVFDSKNRIFAVTIIARDITERKNLELARIRTDEQLRTILEHSRDMYYHHTIDHVLTYVSPQCRQILGCEPEEALVRWTEFITDHPVNKLGIELTQKAINTGEQQPPYLLQLKTKKGRMIWVEVRESPVVRRGRTTGIVGSVTDITEIKIAEDQWKESEERFRVLFETAPDCVFIKDTERRYIDINQSMERIFRKSWENFFGRTDEEVFGPETPEITKANDLRVLQGETLEEEYTHPLDGTPVTHHVVKMPLRDGLGKIVGICGISRNITDRKQAEILLNIQKDLATTLSKTSDLQTALQIILDSVIKIEGIDSGGIYLVDPETHALNLAVHRGLSDTFIKSNMNFEADSPKARLILAGKPVFMTYDTLIKHIKTENFHEGIRFLAVFPILHEDRVIAAFNLAFHQYTDIPNIARSAIEAISLQVGAVIVRIHAENTFHQNEKRFRSLIENSWDGVIVIDENAIIRFVSASDQRILGFLPEERIGKSLFDFSFPEDISQNIKSFSLLSNSADRHLVFEYRVPNRDGQPLILEIVAQNLLDDPAINGFVVNYRDITERIKADELLRISEQRYRELADSLPLTVFQTDVTGRITYVNRTGYQSFGYTETDIEKGLNVIEMIIPEQKEIAKNNVARLFRGEKLDPHELTMRRKDGSIFPVLIMTRVFYDKGSIAGLQGTAVDITTLKTMESALRQSEERYKTLVQNQGEGIGIVDPKDNFTFANPAAEEIFGVFPGELIGKNLRDFTSPERHEFIRKQTEKRRKGVVGSYEVDVIRKDGSTRHILITASPQFDDKKELVCIFGVFRDISDRKRMEEALRKKTEELALLSETVETQLWYLENAETYGTVNSPHARFFGLPKTAMEHKSIRSFLPDPVAQAIVQRNTVVFLEKRSLRTEEWIPNAEGESRLLSIMKTPKLDPTGTVEYVVCSAEDITERKRADEALKESERRLSTLMANLPGMAYRCKNDREWTMEFVSEGSLALTGHPPLDLINNRKLSYNDLIHPDDRERVWVMVQQHVAEDQPYILEYRIRHSSGEEKWVWEQGRYIRDETGRITALEGLVIDSSERKRYEEQLKVSLKEKEVLLKEVHHRVKNNFAVVCSLINLQLSQLNNRKDREWFNETRNRIFSMAKIHEQIYHSKNLAEIDFSEYTRNMVNHLIGIYNRGDVKTRFDIRNVVFNVDTAIPCGLIINELVSNILKYAFPEQKGGEIAILIRRPDAKRCVMTIADNGVGIPKDMDITKVKSLGMTLVINLVNQLGGTIELERKGGTKFTIAFIIP